MGDVPWWELECEDPAKIMPGLYLGSRQAALSLEQLKSRGITHILRVLRDSPPEFPQNITYMIIEDDDHGSSDLLTKFPLCIQFISEGISSGGVLVHCAAGMSRSPTVVLAYLMCTRKLSFNDAYAFVKKARPLICPIQPFLRQLEVFELVGSPSELSSESAVKGKLDLLVRERADGFHHVLPFSNGAPNISILLHRPGLSERVALKQLHPPTLSSSSSASAYAFPSFLCRKCSRVLFSYINVLPHRPQSSSPPAAHVIQESQGQTQVCDSLFVEPMWWFGDCTTISSKITCPKCQEAIGDWDWQGSLACSCGHSTHPAFRILRNSVNVS